MTLRYSPRTGISLLCVCFISASRLNQLGVFHGSAMPKPHPREVKIKLNFFPPKTHKTLCVFTSTRVENISILPVKRERERACCVMCYMSFLSENFTGLGTGFRDGRNS